MHREFDQPSPGDARIARHLRTFFELAGTLLLTEAEEKALLDVSAGELERLRRALPASLPADDKLERRLTYAIPILQRMLAAMEPGATPDAP